MPASNNGVRLTVTWSHPFYAVVYLLVFYLPMSWFVWQVLSFSLFGMLYRCFSTFFSRTDHGSRCNMYGANQGRGDQTISRHGGERNTCQWGVCRNLNNTHKLSLDLTVHYGTGKFTVDVRELKYETFLSHGRQPKVTSKPKVTSRLPDLRWRTWGFPFVLKLQNREKRSKLYGH